MKIKLAQLQNNLPVNFYATKNLDDSGEAVDGPPSFSSVAYTGAKMRPMGYPVDTIVDLQGVTTRNTDGSVNILLDHDPTKLLGQGKLNVTDDKVFIDGLITGENKYSQEVISHAKNGFKWQQSIGGNVQKVEHLKSKKHTAKVNGQNVTGPLLIVRSIEVDETSFTAGGADKNTSAAIAAQFKPEELRMNFQEWLIENGITDADSLSPEALAALESEWEKSQADADTDAEPTPDGDTTDADANADAEPVAATADAVAAAKAELEQELKAYKDDIRKLCASHKAKAGFADKAISNSWTETETLNELLKATRSSRSSYVAPVNPGAKTVDKNKVLEVAMLRAAGYQVKENEFTPDILEAADHSQYEGLGLHGLMYFAAQDGGGDGISAMGMNTNKLRAAFTSHRLAASSGLSTISVSGILSNIANKFLLAGYEANPSVVDKLCRRASSRDFKQMETYRLIDNGHLTKVSPGGEIDHGKLSEEKFTNQVETYGKMISIDRQHLINDDLGAFTNMARVLGLSAFNSREKIILDTLSGATFFTDANGNLISDVGVAAPYNVLNPLSFDGLALAERRLMEQGDGSDENNPIAVMGRYIVCSPQNSLVANQLWASNNLAIAGDTDRTIGEVNVFAGKYEPCVSQFLTGADWYLTADPNSVAVMEIAYLNGRATPVIENSELDFDQLGVQTRVVFDFGVNTQNPKGGVKSIGA